MQTPEEIRERLIKEQYQNFVVADIGTFPQCVAKTKEGKASGKRYTVFKNSSVANNSQFQSLINPQVIPPSDAKAFINFVARKNKSTAGFTLDEGNGEKPLRVAECSNFAYHAVGVLLDDFQIRQQYDVATIGSMYNESTRQYMHNFTLLVPKGAALGDPKQQITSFPKGSLIVDPWAVGMGHPPESALAVTHQNFAYSGALFPAVVNYQSSLDTTLAEVATGQLTPYAGGVPSSVSQKPPKSYAEYTQLWNETFKKIQNDPAFQEIRGNTDKQNIQAIRTVLNDYTKGGDNFWSAIKRFFSGHWNRHHVSEVDKIVKKIDSGGFNDSRALVCEIELLAKKANPTGDLNQRFNFIKEKNNEPEQPIDNEVQRGSGI